jgi:hypothetical protein
MVQKKRTIGRGPIRSLPPVKGFGDHSAEFFRAGFGPYPPKTNLRSVSAFDARELEGYLSRDKKGMPHAGSRFLKLMGRVRNEAKTETQNAYALIEIGDKILESSNILVSKEALIQAMLKNLFLIDKLDLKTAAAFLVRAEVSLTGGGGTFNCTVDELMAHPKEYLGRTGNFGKMAAYLLASLGAEGEEGNFAKSWCQKLGRDAKDLRAILDEAPGKYDGGGAEA